MHRLCYGLGLFAINPAALRCGSNTGLSRSLAFVIDFDEFRFKIAIQSSIVFEENVLTSTLARPSPGSQSNIFQEAGDQQITSTSLGQECLPSNLTSFFSRTSYSDTGILYSYEHADEGLDDSFQMFFFDFFPNGWLTKWQKHPLISKTNRLQNCKFNWFFYTPL